jgi:hypothetical protein
VVVIVPAPRPVDVGLVHQQQAGQLIVLAHRR